MIDGADDPETPPVSRFRLLIVDGDPAVRAEFRRGLGDRFDVLEASNANEALALIDARWFSVVLTDYELSDRDGVWLLEQVLERLPLARRALMSKRGVPNVRGLRDAGIVELFMANPSSPRPSPRTSRRPLDRRAGGEVGPSRPCTYFA